MPPRAALQHPAGQLQPHPPEAHSTTSHSHPCGLRHPLPRLQTGHPWPPNRLPQNPGPTLLWRQRDKGGPSPLPEARTPWGGGEDVSVGPLDPFSVCAPVPQSPGGGDGTLPRRVCVVPACTAALMRVHGAQAHSPQLAWTWLKSGLGT